MSAARVDVRFLLVHNATMEHVQWFDSLPGKPSISAAARAANIQKTTLMRQLDRKNIPAENVIAICRAFGKSAADGLVETGYLTPGDFEGAGVVEALSQATNQQIVDEISKRLASGMGDLFNQDAEVVSFPGADEWGQGEYVADSSSEELFPGDDGYSDGP